MIVPCINSIKALLLFHNDAYNHTSLLCGFAVYRTPAQQAGMLP
jgi:hypothetical protein